MSRIPGVQPRQAGWLTRLLFWLARRKVKKVTGRDQLLEPLKVKAHHPRLLFAFGLMELGQDAANSVPRRLKELACIKVATIVGCPY